MVLWWGDPVNLSHFVIEYISYPVNLTQLNSSYLYVASYILIGSLSANMHSACSQVQSDHYDEFFAPELDKHGYYGLYKRKTNEVVAVF